MTSQTPPYPYFNGIVYNSSFFTSSSSSGAVSGSLYYPTAQGAEYFPYGLSSVGITNAGTISTGVLSSGLISSTNNIQAVGSITGASLGNTAGTGGISATGALTGTSLDTTAPTSTFNFLSSQSVGINMGTSLPSGQTIQIGTPGSTAGVSVHCSNIDFTNNSINNATSASGDLNIATNQLSGTLNFGANTFRTGNINIGTGGLGGVISIGSTTGGLNSLVCKGSTGSSISIDGPISSGNITSTGFISGAGITGTSLNVGSGTIKSGAITSTGSITGTGITGTSLNVGTGTIISGAITSTGSITGTGITGTSLNVGTGTIISGAITSTGSITGTGITGTSFTSTGDIKTTAGKLIGGTLDAVADTIAGTTALKIGSNVILGDIEIGNSQTTGDIKIGLSDTSGATITIGTSSTATTINGTLTTTGAISTSGNISTTGIGTITSAGLLTASSGFTLSGDKCITLGTPTTTPTSSQLGYYLNASVSGIGSNAGVLTTFQTTTGVPIGIYWITFSGFFNAFSANTGYFVPTFTTSNATTTIGSYQLGGNSGANVGYSYTGVVKATASGATITFQGTWNGANATLSSGSYSLIRIA